MSIRLLVAFGAALALGFAACGGDGGAGSGSTHALGEAVVVEHSPAVNIGEIAPAPTTLAVTVVKVRHGTQAELKQAGFTLDPDEQKRTPYYVDTRFANQGGPAIDRLLFVSLEDGDGNSVRSTTVIDFGGPPFKLCPQSSKGMLKPGETYERCALFLVPEGTEPEKVSFLPYAPDTPTDFVYWDVA